MPCRCRKEPNGEAFHAVHGVVWCALTGVRGSLMPSGAGEATEAANNLCGGCLELPGIPRTLQG
eukprot:7459529-Alexandrium_andersonii.AAC.1